MSTSLKVLNVKQVAEKLGITPKAVYEKVFKRQIPFRRWGRKVVFLDRDIDVFLEGLPLTPPLKA